MKEKRKKKQQKQKQRIKACCGGVQILNNMRRVILFDMFK